MSWKISKTDFDKNTLFFKFPTIHRLVINIFIFLSKLIFLQIYIYSSKTAFFVKNTIFFFKEILIVHHVFYFLLKF